MTKDNPEILEELVEELSDDEIHQELLELADEMETLDYELELGERRGQAISLDEAEHFGIVAY